MKKNLKTVLEYIGLFILGYFIFNIVYAITDAINMRNWKKLAR